MSTPISPQEGSSGPPSRRGFHLPQRQPWARGHLQASHEDALNAFGEYSLFVLMWSHVDYEAGRVGRCPRCTTIYSDDEDVSQDIFNAFRQPVEDRCLSCFGTTFDGGWKAKLVRPSMWDYSEERWSKTARGYVVNNTGSVQSTADFFMRDGDYVFRADGTRWRASGAQQTRLIDGFGHPSRADSNMGINFTQVTREDKTAIPYSIKPTTRTELTDLLDVVAQHAPEKYREKDQVRGPILPESNDFSPVDYRPIDHHPGSPRWDP